MDIRVPGIPAKHPITYALIFGLLMAVTFSLIWVIGAAADGNWVFGADMISDLGVSETYAHYVFGWGGIISGFFGFMCFLFMTRSSEEKYGKIAFSVMCLAAVMLMFVGIFNEHTPYHTPSAISLFILTWISMVILSFRDFFRGSKFMAIVNAVPAVYIPVSLALMPMPLFEALGVICLLIWVAVLSVASYRRAKGYGDA